LIANEHLSFCQFALAAWLSPMEAVREMISPARADIKELAEKLNDLPQPLVVPSAFVLMALGLRAKDLHGASLIVRSFDTVNNALATKNHPSESWELLSPQLPYLGWLRDWDRCAKIKLAVHTWLVRYAGSIDRSLENALRDVHHLTSESGMHQDEGRY
jgi:hypothetical protein